MRLPLTSRHKGSPFCGLCGEEVRWIRLENGAWIQAEKKPVLYIPEAGRQWILEGKKYKSRIIKDAKIWKPGMPIEGVKRGYQIHAFNCWAERRK